MRNPREVEFAACLLEIGGPPYLVRKDDGALVSRVDHMMAAAHWYDKHISPNPTTPGENNGFTEWWISYKEWLQESRHGH